MRGQVVGVGGQKSVNGSGNSQASQEVSKLGRYGIAVLCVAASLAVRLVLDPVVGSDHVLFAFILAIVVAARFGGRGPGLLASALSVPAAWYFLIEPRFSFAIARPADVGLLLVLPVAGIGISLLIGRPPMASNPGSLRKTGSGAWRRMALYGGACLTLLVLTQMLYADFRREKDRQQWVAHSYQVLNTIQAVLSDLQEAETEQRGYLLIGDESSFDRFRSAMQAEQSARQALRRLTLDNPSQQARLNTVDRLVEAWSFGIWRALAAYRKDGFEAARAQVRTDGGKRIMDECRAGLRVMEDEDRRLLSERSQAAEGEAMRTRWVLGTGSGCLLMLLLIAAAVIERETAELVRQRQLLADSNNSIRESDAVLRSLFDSPDVMRGIVTLVDGLIVHVSCNDTAAKMYGFDREAIAGKPAAETGVAKEVAQKWVGVYEEAQLTGKPVSMEYARRDAAGQERWLLATAAYLGAQHPGSPRFGYTILDLTDRKRAEEALRRSEARLRSLGDNLPEAAIYQYRQDLNGRPHVDFVSAGIERITGVPAAEFMREAATVDLAMAPEDIDRFNAAIAVSREQLTKFEVEVRHKHRVTGETRWSLMRSTPARNPDGSTTWNGVGLDITERKLAEEAVREQQAKLQAALASMSDAVFISDVEGRFINFNDAFATFHRFRSRDECAKSFAEYPEILEVFLPDGTLRPPADWAVPRALRGEAATNAEYVLRRKDTGETWVGSYSFSPIRGRDRAITGAVVVARDITERKRAEEEILSRSAVIRAINRVFSGALSCETDEALGCLCLAIAEELTGSRFGFIGEINAAGRLDDIAISDPGWDVCRIEKPEGERRVPTGFAIHGIYGRVLLDGKGFYTNDPHSHPERIGLPDGHPPLKAFLGVPLVRAEKTIGMIAVGNRDGGYRPRDLEALEALAPSVVQVLMRKRAEDRLRDSEDQFRTLANAIPQLCWMANADGWIFWYNRRWYEYTGATPEQMAGWGWKSVHDPAALPKVMDRWNASIATGEPLDMVFPLRAADGTFHPFLTRVMPVRGRDGKVVRWFGTNTDISEQQMTEEALRQAYEQRRLALEAAELGAWDYRFQTGDVFWDDACRTMFGVPQGSQIDYDEAISRIHPEDGPATRKAVTEAIAGANGGAYHREFRVVWPDGSLHWIASHGRAHLGETGGCQAVRFMGVNMEITERKQVEREILLLNAQLEERVRQRTAQIEAANQELEAFSYSVSHDLRAPLRHVGAFLELLEDHIGGGLDQKGHHYFDTVKDSARQMGKLIDDLLRFSRTGRIEMRHARIGTADLVGQVQRELAPSIKDRKVVWTVKPLPEVTADAALLKQVFVNLFDNAIKYTGTREEAAIEIGCREEGQEWIFYVQDNGVGFDMRYAHKLFSVFQRLHGKGEFEGTGIGLANVRRIVGRHGGRTWAEGAVDQGATFYFSLPRGAGEEAGGQASEPSAAFADREGRVA